MAKMRRTGRKITSQSQLRAIHATIDLGSPGGRAKRKKNGAIDLAAARKANKIGLKATAKAGVPPAQLTKKSKSTTTPMRDKPRF